MEATAPELLPVQTLMTQLAPEPKTETQKKQKKKKKAPGGAKKSRDQPSHTRKSWCHERDSRGNICKKSVRWVLLDDERGRIERGRCSTCAQHAFPRKEEESVIDYKKRWLTIFKLHRRCVRVPYLPCCLGHVVRVITCLQELVCQSGLLVGCLVGRRQDGRAHLLCLPSLPLHPHTHALALRQGASSVVPTPYTTALSRMHVRTQVWCDVKSCKKSSIHRAIVDRKCVYHCTDHKEAGIEYAVRQRSDRLADPTSVHSWKDQYEGIRDKELIWQPRKLR